MVIFDRIIEYGILFLIVFTPLALGTVPPWAYTIMGIIICFLVIISISRLIIVTIKKTSTTLKPLSLSDNPQSHISQTAFSINRFGLAKTPLNIPIILFIGLIMFQLIPLSPGLLKFISPNTYNLYSDTLPGWPDEALFPEQSPSEPERSLSPESETPDHNPEIYGNKPSIIKKTAFHSNRMPISTYPFATKMKLLNILVLIGMFFIITNTPNLRIKRVIVIIISVGFIISLLGILQRLSGTAKIYWAIESYNPFPFGTYLNRNHFAGYICMVIPLAFGLLISRFTSSGLPVSMKRHAKAAEPQSYFFTSLLLAFVIMIMITALFLSLSRGGIITFSVSIIAFLIIIAVKMFLTNRGKDIGIILLVLSITFVFLIWIGLDPVLHRLSDFSDPSRLIIYQDTINMAKDFPIFGTGLGTFPTIYRKYKTLDNQFLYPHAHNDYLELLSDQGLAGFLIVMIGIVLFFWKIMPMWWKRRDPYVNGVVLGGICGIIAILVHSLVDFNLHIPANALFLSIILGLICNTVILKRNWH